MINNSYSLDIVNSLDQNWDKGQWLNFFRDRLIKMRSKRASFDTLWNEIEQQVNAVSFYDNEGNLNVNIPLEKTIREIYMGKTNGKVPFDIIPDGQTDIEQLQPTKYAMQFFMDGNEKDNFWKENRYLRLIKSDYGSGIFYTGIRSYKDTRMVIKDGVEIQSGTDLLNKNNFEEKENETWFFFPKALHCKDFFIDDMAYGQPDVQYAEDCIMKERVTMLELRNRYKDNKAIDQEELNKVNYWTDINQRNENDKPVDQRIIVLYHYFHRLTKKYIIVANEINLLFNGYYLYNDGKLPFVNIQHYSTPNRFRGEGIPERIAYLKAYKSEIFQDILSGAAMSSGVHLVVGNDDEIGQDWTIGGRGINLLRTTGGVDQINPINTSPNLGYFTTVIQLIDRETTINSGINPVEQIDPQSDKVGIVEIMESRGATRSQSIDENYNIGLDEALTMMLSRIKQFAPSLLKEEIKDSDGRVIKTIFPKIRIDNYKIEKEKGKQVFVESIGKYGYFELKPDIVQGIGVKVVTPSTNSTLPILERQKITEYINNIMTLANVAQIDQTGEMMNKLKETIRFDELIKWIGDAYQYDINGLKANSEKDKIVKENLDKINKLKSLLTIPTNETSNINTPSQIGGQNQGETMTNINGQSGNSNSNLGAENQGFPLQGT